MFQGDLCNQAVNGASYRTTPSAAFKIHACSRLEAVDRVPGMEKSLASQVLFEDGILLFGFGALHGLLKDERADSEWDILFQKPNETFSRPGFSMPLKKPISTEVSTRIISLHAVPCNHSLCETGFSLPDQGDSNGAE